MNNISAAMHIIEQPEDTPFRDAILPAAIALDQETELMLY
mgnify:CR=1 FL=1